MVSLTNLLFTNYVYKFNLEKRFCNFVNKLLLKELFSLIVHKIYLEQIYKIKALDQCSFLDASVILYAHS